MSAAVVAESRRPARPSRDVDGCLVGCDASDWSEHSDGTRRRRGREGCLAGCDGDKDPITARRSRGCLSPAFDLVDGVKDPKTGERRGGCYARMFGEPNPETGARRGGCLAPIVGCVAADADVDSDSKRIRTASPAAAPRTASRRVSRGRVRRRGGFGDGRASRRMPGAVRRRRGSRDGSSSRRVSHRASVWFRGSRRESTRRRVPRGVRRRYPLGRFGSRRENARRRRSRGSRGTETKRMPRGRVSRGVRRRRVGASRRRRRRRDGDGGDEDEDEEGRGDEKGKEEKGTRRRPAKKKNDASSSSEWAETKWRRKPSGYLDVRDAALGARERARARVAYDFAKPSAVLSALLAAFFAPATWRLLSRLVDVTRERPARDSLPARDSPPPLPRHATAEARRARARDAEEALVDAREGRFRFFSIATSRFSGRRSARCFSRRPST